jgi:hypothetical protein
MRYAGLRKNNHPAIGTDGMSFKRWAGIGLGILSFSFCLLLLPCVQRVQESEGWVRSCPRLEFLRPNK